MAYEITQITSKNMSLLQVIAPDVFDYEVSQQHLTRYVAQENHALFVAHDDGRTVGQVRGIVHFQPDEPPHLYIDNLGVSPAYQRLGVAKALFAAIENWAKPFGANGFWVATECDNEAGNGFYRALGLEAETMYFYEREA